MGKIDWDVVTNYTDVVTTVLKTVTFPKVQEQVYLRNQGNANFTYTIGSQSGTLTPGQSVTVNQDVSSFTLQAVSGTHTFELRAKEKGTEQTEPETDVMSLLENDIILPPSYKAYGVTYDTRITNSIIRVGPTRKTTKIADAIQNAQEGTKIYVDAGTYDIYQEMGGDTFFNTYNHNTNGSGLVLHKDIEIIFSPNAKVVFNYTGSNTEVMQYFSPFNASASGRGGFKLIGLNLTTSKCRYAIHDEHSSDSVFYYNVYRNCTITHDNTNNTAWTALQCIGGGLGTKYESKSANNYGIVSR
jgi:hypothetical protein